MKLLSCSRLLLVPAFVFVLSSCAKKNEYPLNLMGIWLELNPTDFSSAEVLDCDHTFMDLYQDANSYFNTPPTSEVSYRANSKKLILRDAIGETKPTFSYHVVKMTMGTKIYIRVTEAELQKVLNDPTYVPINARP